MKKILTIGIGCLLSCNVLAIDQLILDPSPQSTSNTCQSYSLAYSLAHSGYWPEQIETPKQLRKLEQEVRLHIEAYVKEFNQGKPEKEKLSVYHHTTWVEAVKRVSSNNLKLTLSYPSTPNEYYQKIADKTEVTSSQILGAPISAALVKTPVMTSVKKLNNDTYNGGHVVTLMGLTKDIPKNRSLRKMDQKVLVLNSAVKSNQKVFNMCSDEITSGDKKYSASVNLTNEYTLKNWDGKYLLMWIDKN